MNDKAEEVLALSDEGDAGDCDGTVSPTPATVPKKRGRPSNAEKLKKVPSGRGRGRPSKGSDGGTIKKAIKTAEASDEEVTASDGGSPVPNGDSGEVVSSGRGRQPKGKRKLTHTIEATGKGRGRPKKTAKADVADDDDEGADDNDGASSDYKPGKKANAKAAKKGRGRPKKAQDSDEESSDDKMDDYVEKRPVGRPPSGGINLNIVRTGRGQGRPKKTVAAKRAALAENGGSTRGRGRPSTSGKGAYVPTGKPRGRPKATVQEKDSQDDDDEDEEEEITDENPAKKVALDNSADDDDEAEKNSGGEE